jgi:LysW-gamma-L-lysine/LysW-L-ornithine aminotransferase
MNGDARLLRAFPAKPMTVVRAENTTLWDETGRSYTDLGGASQGVAVIGHNHPAVVAAVREQAGRLLHVAQTIPNDARGRFLDALHDLLGPHYTQTFLANSGTEAVECALKLAVAATGRNRLAACVGAFHGRSSGALSVTHRAAFRAPFGALLAQADHVPFDDVEALKSIGSDVAALVLEPVQGEGGVRAASNEFLRAARDHCDERGIMLVFDEVQSGMGRTGTFLASQPSGVQPDAVLLGKGLAGGVPIGSCSVSERLAAALPPGGHGSTYGGAPLACAAGEAALGVLVKERLMQRVEDVGPRFHGLKHDAVRRVRGAGMMVGIDLPVRPAPVLQHLQEAGFLALSAGTTEVRLLPPLTMPIPQVEASLAALRASLDVLVASA